jgi:PQQ system protein
MPREGSDGLMHGGIVAPSHRMKWQPAVIDMPHGGALELHFSNYDEALHMAYLPAAEECAPISLRCRSRAPRAHGHRYAT